MSRDPVMQVDRQGIRAQKLVYVILADRRFDYFDGRSKIVYIGTTQRGLNRIASSVAKRAPEVLALRGVRRFEVRVLTCRGRQRVRTWRTLERAMIMVFRDRFGEIPLCNSQGEGLREIDEFRYFSRARLERIVDDLS
jgi:hypothetical protein